jgi:hypothetical protein
MTNIGVAMPVTSSRRSVGRSRPTSADIHQQRALSQASLHRTTPTTNTTLRSAKATSFNTLAAHLGSMQAFGGTASMNNVGHRPKSTTMRHRTTEPIEDDYVKNLQQQVYLLELETRYL